MLPNLVHGDPTLLGGIVAQTQSRIDLFGKDSLESIRQGFAQFQTESHGVFLTEGETHVAVSLFACHFPSKPPRWLESLATGGVRKFHLRNDKILMSPPILIDFNNNIVPENFVTHLTQSSSGRTRPEHCELFRA